MADQQSESPIVVREFGDLASAIVARGILDSAGIWCFLEGENMAAQGRSHGPLKLIVRGDDAVVADSLLQGGANESELSPNEE
ncbi:MAG: hypothetical protein JO119_12495 [Acidobacteria bacterium]|nr:hypothetical protein [Acidobacteriota bacterium]